MARNDEASGLESEASPLGRGSNQRALRAHNERLILTLLRGGPKPKAEVARITGLSPQTASVIMRNLEREGLLERCDPVRGKIGQPSIPMRLARDGALFFGLKVGRRSADLVLVDFLGKVLGQVHATYPYPTPEATLRFVAEAVAKLSKPLGQRQRGRIAGLGIAMPSFMWEWTEIIGVPAGAMEPWRDRDLRAEIEELVEFPVYLQNDATCACGAELVFGSRDRKADFLYLFIGYFIGGGVVVNNQLVTGPTGNAGALGTLPLPSGARSTRQLVEVASLSTLEALIAEAGGDSGALWESSEVWNVDPKLFEAWLRQTAGALAHAVVAACSVIDFQEVMIDGWMPREVRRALVAEVARRLPEFNLAGLVRPEIVEGSIGPDARSIGAASLALSERYLVAQSAF